MKALFITHDTSIYGASKSLQALLKNYNGVTIDLAINKNFLKNADFARIKDIFGPNISNIYRLYLPFKLCYEVNIPVARFVKIVKRNFFWKLHKKSFYNLIARNKYDFIHLNSLVLYLQFL